MTQQYLQLLNNLRINLPIYETFYEFTLGRT